MQYKVNSDTLNDTVNCKENFSCLYGNRACLCQIDGLCELKNNLDFTTLIIKPININKPCGYRVQFGTSYFCDCPTRKEIHRLYEI
jgi:hypothetical protein